MTDEIKRQSARSSYITARWFVFRLTLVTGLSIVSGEFAMAFWVFSLLAATICAVQALLANEPWFGPRLGHWDEALLFLFLSQLGHLFVG